MLLACRVIGAVALAGLAAATLGLSRPGLGAATRATLEAVGLGVFFLAANLTLATLAVALARAVTGGFVPVYAIDDLGVVAADLGEPDRPAAKPS